MGNQQPFRAAPTELAEWEMHFAIDISLLTALAIRRLAGLAFQQSCIGLKSYRHLTAGTTKLPVFGGVR